MIGCNRPLRVKELAEVLAIKFDADGTANVQTGWGIEEAEEAVLSTCSTLIMVVNNDDYRDLHGDDKDASRIIQFSHFSVKEFLTSSRLTSSRPSISRYHVLLGSSHTILAQACLSALLRLDDSTDEENIRNFPLAIYAAHHWHIHALQENVKPRIQSDIERLFDLGKPHYAAWTWIYDSGGIIRQHLSIPDGRPSQPEAPPLFYAARLGSRDLVEDLIATRPQDINVTHIHNGPPLLSALLGGHLEIAELLIEHGAQASIPDISQRTPLSEISAKGYLQLLKLVFKHGVETEDRWTEASSWAIVEALRNGQFDIASFLLHHDVDINARANRGETSLHKLTGELVEDLKKVQWSHGADVSAPDNHGRIPLTVVSQHRSSPMTQSLPELEVDMKAHDQDCNTASQDAELDIIRLLLHHGADTTAKNKFGETPLHKAARFGGGTKVMKLLIEHGADVDAETDGLNTPLHYASAYGSLDMVRFLVEHGADISAMTKRRETLLHMASHSTDFEVVRFFVDRGADVNAKTNNLETPLHVACEHANHEVVGFLVERGADTNAETEKRETPLHWASGWGNTEVVRLLVERGANIGAETKKRETPLHWASKSGNWDNLEIIQFLVDQGADVNAKADDLRTPLHLASENGFLGIVQFLADSGAVIDAETVQGETPLHMVSRSIHGRKEVAQFLVERGLDVSAKTKDGQTPLHLASQFWDISFDMLEFLVENGANIDAWTKSHETPLHLAAKCGNIRVVRFLIGRGADVNSKTDDLQTPLHVASEMVGPELIMIHFICREPILTPRDSQMIIIAIIATRN